MVDVGCISDVRLAGKSLPMSASENARSSAGEYSPRSQHVQRGCESEACGRLAGGTTCRHGLLCVDLWRHAECRSVPVYADSLLPCQPRRIAKAAL